MKPAHGRPRSIYSINNENRLRQLDNIEPDPLRSSRVNKLAAVRRPGSFSCRCYRG
jgi:hypothetical protein